MRNLSGGFGMLQLEDMQVLIQILGKKYLLGACAGNTNTSGCCNVAIGYDVELPSATGMISLQS